MLTNPQEILNIQEEIRQLSKKVSTLNSNSDKESPVTGKNIYTLIATHFDEQAFMSCLKSFDANYREFSAHSYSAHISNFIRYTQKRGKLSEFKEALSVYKPEINWANSFPAEFNDSLIVQNISKLPTHQACAFLLNIYFSHSELDALMLKLEPHFKQAKEFELFKHDFISLAVTYSIYWGKSDFLIQSMKNERPRISSIQSLPSRLIEKPRLEISINDLFQTFRKKERFIPPNVKSKLFQQTIENNFSSIELQELCFDLNLNIEASKRDITYFLNEHLANSGPNLQAKMKTQLILMKPSIEWDVIIQQSLDQAEIPQDLLVENKHSNHLFNTFAVRQLAFSIWESNEDLFQFCRKSFPFMRSNMSTLNDKRENIFLFMEGLMRRGRFSKLLIALEAVYAESFLQYGPYKQSLKKS